MVVKMPNHEDIFVNLLQVEVLNRQSEPRIVVIGHISLVVQKYELLTKVRDFFRHWFGVMAER
jgi:hypothetical protein